MTFVRTLCFALVLPLASTAGCASATAAGAQTATTTAAAVASHMSITMPQEDADLLVDGQPVDGSGAFRMVPLRTVRRGTRVKTVVTAQWKPNGYTEMTRTKEVQFTAGDEVTVDLSLEDPNDRVKVIYVPTPQDVAEEMARLAEVGPNDVVYEPGCGDARITIAAMRRGARRAICIDIDEERARESRANVKAAGLADRIDVRHGDALDLKDLSQVTVVLLYMGDHFNLLIRPVLWRDLPVGSRIVSHQFTMGDWPPDRTVHYASEQGGDFQLHLWTITEEVKKRGAAPGATVR
jgi:uncharacterized protein (TIGR03000 family)